MENNQNDSFRFFLRLYRRWNDFRSWFANSLDADTERKSALYIDLSRSATLKDIVYWLQLLFSAGIATMGLVQNSSAVIIGAMLISPLMAPILSGGLALATGDLTLGVRAFVNLFLSSVLGLGFAFILVKLLPFQDLTVEISARTTPNTLDLVIALFSGAIGAVATCRETKGVVTSIPGVAIAVALMPPLCVIGYGLALGGDNNGWAIAKGGGLLYLTNLVAITFTAMLVFVLLRIDRSVVREKVHEWRVNDEESVFWVGLINRIPRLEKARQVRSFTLRLLMILIPLIVIYVPLSQSFAEVREQFQRKQDENIKSQIAQEIWSELIKKRSRTELDEMRVKDDGEKLTIYARAFSNEPFTDQERAGYIGQVAGRLEKKPEQIDFQVIMIPTSEKDNVGIIAEATPTPKAIRVIGAEFRQRIDSALATFRLTKPAEKVGHSIVLGENNQVSLVMYYLSSREIQADGQTALETSLRQTLDLPTLTLSLSRVSSVETSLPFEGNTAELDTDNDQLANLIADLRVHKNLNVRVMLKSDGEDDKLFNDRKKAVSDFLFKEETIPENRVVFTETEAEVGGNTFQLYLRK